MRNIFLLFLFICITGSGWAQLLYPEVMEPRTPLNGPVVNKLTGDMGQACIHGPVAAHEAR